MNHNGADTWAKRITIGALFVVVLGLVGFLTRRLLWPTPYAREQVAVRLLRAPARG